MKRGWKRQKERERRERGEKKCIHQAKQVANLRHRSNTLSHISRSRSILRDALTDGTEDNGAATDRLNVPSRRKDDGLVECGAVIVENLLRGTVSRDDGIFPLSVSVFLYGRGDSRSRGRFRSSSFPRLHRLIFRLGRDGGVRGGDERVEILHVLGNHLVGREESKGELTTVGNRVLIPELVLHPFVILGMHASVNQVANVTQHRHEREFLVLNELFPGG